MKIIISFILLLKITSSLITDVNQAKNFLQRLNRDLEMCEVQLQLATYEYRCDLTEKNLQKYISYLKLDRKKKMELWQEAKNYDWRNIDNVNVKRQFQLFILTLNTAVLPEEKNLELENLIVDCSKVLSTKISKNPGGKPELSKSEVEDFFETSRNATELFHFWIEWSKVVAVLRVNFTTFTDLMNEAGKLNNLRHAGDMLLAKYEINDVKNEAKKWWTAIEPFYKQLHAYVRYKLNLYYGDIVPKTGGIPVHLLGNLYGKTWLGIKDLIIPYPDREGYANFESILTNQGYTPLSMCKTASEFMASLNFPPLPNSFWLQSTFKANKNVNMASDIFSSKSNVKFCRSLKVTGKDFFIAHRYMFAAYLHNSKNFRTPFLYYNTAPIPNFYISLADSIVTSVRTPLHLRKLAIISRGPISPQEVINNQFFSALHTVADMIYNYTVAVWRWDVFAGRINKNFYNCEWWRLRFELQGVVPPIERSESDFDPAFEHRVTMNFQAFSYFIGSLFAYQCHRQLCIEAGLYLSNTSKIALNECDIYGSIHAGELIKEALALVKSEPFPAVLEVLTGKRRIDVTGFLEYFKPLMEWLQEENKKNGAYIGWDVPQQFCNA